MSFGSEADPLELTPSRYIHLVGRAGAMWTTVEEICVIVPNFMQRSTSSRRCEDIGRFSIFKMAAVRHLGFVVRLFGPPTKCIFGGFCHCAKFGLNWCSSFSFNILSIGLKTPIHFPKLGFWGNLTTKWGAVSTRSRDPQKAHRYDR